MRAIIQSNYGGPEVFALSELPLPTLMDGEVLVRVRAASLHPDVWHVMAGVPYLVRAMGSGLRRPKYVVPGTDMAGVVEAVSDGVTTLAPGDAVYGECLRGHQWKNGGTFAEYVAVHASALAKKPAHLSFEEAAALPTAGFIALQVVRQEGEVKAGQHVLVNGAAGGVGSLAVQLARALGATVTGVDHTSKQELLRTLGVDHALDYTQEDFTTRNERYDVIIDIPGNHAFAEVRRALKPEGRWVLVGHDHYGVGSAKLFGSVPRMMGLLLRSNFTQQLPGLRGAKPAPDRLEVLSNLAAAGKLKPVIDRTFALEQVREAMQYLTSGEARGRIVLTV